MEVGTANAQMPDIPKGQMYLRSIKGLGFRRRSYCGGNVCRDTPSASLRKRKLRDTNIAVH